MRVNRGTDNQGEPATLKIIVQALSCRARLELEKCTVQNAARKI